MSSKLTLSKAQAQASPYVWVWSVRGTRSVAGKYLGTTQFYLEGTDDTALIDKINSHEGYRTVDLGKPIHG